jgi:hypothetical protein
MQGRGAEAMTLWEFVKSNWLLIAFPFVWLTGWFLLAMWLKRHTCGAFPASKQKPSQGEEQKP